jgi:hypothetical protein
MELLVFTSETQQWLMSKPQLHMESHRIEEEIHAVPRGQTIA